MPDTSNISVASLAPEQAVDLSILIDLEACWDNLGNISSRPHDGHLTLQSLHQRQKAYDTFIAKLMNYNKRYAPVHVPEQRLNTPGPAGDLVSGDAEALPAQSRMILGGGALSMLWRKLTGGPIWWPPRRAWAASTQVKSTMHYRGCYPRPAGFESVVQWHSCESAPVECP